MIGDLKAREDDRQVRENDILKDLIALNKKYDSNLDKHIRKMLRKSLMLTVDPQPSAAKEQTQMILTQKFSSQMHVASIMNERTPEEKQMFGKVDLTEYKVKSKHSG